MAEVFGVVGSAVGVAGFAFQIADGIKKLADFCQAVRDAPADLQDALSELVDLAELYKEVGQQIEDQQISHPTALPSRIVLDRLLERSRRNLDDLEALLVDMEAEVKKRQFRGSIRAVLKKETFARFQKRVERTKHTLQLSYMAYCNALSRQEAQCMHREMQKVSAVTHHISAIANQVSIMGPQLGVLVTNSTFKLPQPGHVIQPRIASKKTVYYRLRLPTWLHSQVYEMAYSYSTNVWTTQFRVYNTVSYLSPFMQACYLGDLATVKSILDVEPAHVYDQEEHGQTALHVAVDGRVKLDSVDIVKLLISRGADISRNAGLNLLCRTPFQNLLGNPFFEPSYVRKYSLQVSDDIVCELANALEHPNCLEDEDKDDFEGITRLHLLKRGLRSFSQMPVVVEMIQNMMSPPWLTRPLGERMSLLAGGISHVPLLDSTCLTRREFELILGSKLTSVVWEIDKLAEGRFTFRMMHNIGAAFRSGNAEDIEGWRDVLQQIVSSGISLTEPVLLPGCSVAPIQQFLFGYISAVASERQSRHIEDQRLQHQRLCQQGILNLAKELQIAGLDLKQHNFEAESDWKGTRLHDDRWKHLSRVLLFQQGPQPQDWNLFVSDMREEYAYECCGDFWDMIEHPERMMPGAWCEQAPDFGDWECSHAENYYRYRPTSDF
ncbi:hypothetical protein D6C88_01584 [Aureobasidium pullulans]|nr:hypothetical protein D6C88_01584 [Aureobasidium pullulans]